MKKLLTLLSFIPSILYASPDFCTDIPALLSDRYLDDIEHGIVDFDPLLDIDENEIEDKPPPLLPVSTTCSMDFTDHDILLGRGGKVNQHIGNIWFRNILAINRAKYQALTSCQFKSRFTDDLLQMIKAEGGRFLAQKKGLLDWEEVSDEKARKKISQFLREKPH